MNNLKSNTVFAIQKRKKHPTIGALNHHFTVYSLHKVNESLIWLVQHACPEFAFSNKCFQIY